jgi:predicted RNase H-like nuclease (RuvC/YqgF family)
VKAIPHFSREGIQDYVGRVGLKVNDIVLLEDASGGGAQTAALLIEHGVRAVIVDTPISHLAEQELVKATIPVIDAQAVELERVDEFAFISRRKLEIQLQGSVKEAKERARQRSEEDLVELIERYRREIER